MPVPTAHHMRRGRPAGQASGKSLSVVRRQLYCGIDKGTRSLVNDDRPPATPASDSSRRLHPRAEVRLAVVVSAADLDDVPMLIHNVSRDGMLIVFAAPTAPAAYSVGKRIRIAVAPVDDDTSTGLELDAQVRWAFAYGIGVKVSETDAATMTALRQAAAERLKGAGSTS